MKTQTECQNKEILSYLLKGNGLTSLEALNSFKCLRLSARIHDIKNKLNHEIKSKRIVVDSGKSVSLYYHVKFSNKFD